MNRKIGKRTRIAGIDVPGIRVLPARNRAERRRKVALVRQVARSGFMRKHGGGVLDALQAREQTGVWKGMAYAQRLAGE